MKKQQEKKAVTDSYVSSMAGTYIVKQNGPQTIPIHEAKSNLSKLVKRAAAGETIYIGAYGKPEAAIVSTDKVLPNKKPVSEAFGCMRGKIKFHKGWDDPLPDDIIESFYSMQGLEDFETK
jgi:prevent-host-death family protein